MKKLFYSFVMLSSAMLFAQKNTATRFAVANGIVGTVDMFNNKKDMIQSMNVYKTTANLPQSLKQYSYIADNGISEFKIKSGYENLDRISLASLNEQHNIPKDHPVIIDGYTFSDTATQVYGDILARTEVKDYEGKKTLFISTK
ncbi:hypothetical protein [uncultured Chryseobacterium sp.]|uniref:hypothetical protein n=1 Tax=uncultured Chryseobacterium sp. TaxID=259322 RepID=UPI0025F89946|nr:hypothetical protein [uncultured Chryseobacterium sp.]